MGRLHVSGELVARGSLLNFIGQVIPLVFGVITAPTIVRRLGIERYGLLSLTWMVLAYFSIFDLGLGRVTIKYVAETWAKGREDHVPRLVWTLVAVLGVLGVAAALILGATAPVLVDRVFNVSAALVEEARATLYVLSIGIPLVFISGAFSGVLEARQRFDLVNGIKILASSSTYLLPLLGLMAGMRLPGIVGLILASRLLSLALLIVLAFRVSPNLCCVSLSLSELSGLLAYGVWITVSNAVGLILTYLDRFMVASLLSMAAVAYYSAPYDAVTRLWIVPASVTTTLFPTFSALEARADQQQLEALFARSLKYVLLILGPVVLLIVLFADEILHAWLGSEFARISSTALQLLAVGVLINSLSHIPYVLLQGVGRPDVVAKLHTLELPFYAVVSWGLVSRWGITGAAATWTLRVALDMMLLLLAAFRVCNLSPDSLWKNGFGSATFALLLLAGISYGLRRLAHTLPLLGEIALAITLLGAFGWIVWRNVLDSSDRYALSEAVKLWQEP
jgi:O-antigen/teichoic acid export membrane protein